MKKKTNTCLNRIWVLKDSKPKEKLKSISNRTSVYKVIRQVQVPKEIIFNPVGPKITGVLKVKDIT